MMHLHRILFPTDGSVCAERARRHALHLAHRFDASVHVIQVEERDADLSDVIEVREADVLGDLDIPTNGLDAVAAPRIQERRVIHPSAADGILSYAVEHDAHLIVLGTHGRRGVQRMILGSVAETVVRRAPCPVFTVGRNARRPTSVEGDNLLVPVDFSDHQPLLLAHARELALAYGLTLTLLHVVRVPARPKAYGSSRSRPSPEELRNRSENALTEEAAALQHDGVDARVEVRSGHPVEEIIDVADDLDAALLAIATHGRAGVQRMLMGSVAETVIRRAPCPVFTVKSFGRSLVSEP